jgi:Cell wall-active antibiotics response 4TMS YvqF
MTRGVSLLLTLVCAAPLAAQHVRTLESSRLLADVLPVAVRLQLGTGTLNVGAADAHLLYRSIDRFGDLFAAPRSDWNAAQRTLTLTAGRRDDTHIAGGDDADDSRVHDWRVQLTRRAPLELSIEAKAATAMIDLTGLPLRRFSLSSGASQTTVRFDAANPELMSVMDANVGAGGMTIIGLGNSGASESRIESSIGDVTLDLGGRWLRDMQIVVSSTVGNVKITAPPTVGIELQSTGLLARESFDGTFVKTNGSWRSTNFGTAAVRIRIVVKSMLGKVELIQR